MTERTLLLATFHFPPSAAVAVHRMLGFARYLPKFGWRLVVVAPPHVPGEPEDAALMQQIPPETTVIRVSFPRGMWSKVVGKFAPLGRWIPSATQACARAVREYRPDALLTSSPPSCIHYLGLYLKMRFDIPWVASFRDPWITNRGFGLPLNPWERIEAPMEAKVFGRADAVVANTPLNLEGLHRAYPHLCRKMTAITNGFDPERFPQRNVGGHSNPSNGERLTILHAGELYSGRDPRPVLDALRDIEAGGNGSPDKPHFRLEFLGRATEAIFDLPGEVRRRVLDQIVSLTSQAPYAQALERMVAADILLLIHSPGFKVGVPAKLYEYLGAGRPVLALAEPDGDIAWVLKTSGVPHRIVPPHDAAKIKQALLELGRELRAGAALSPASTRLFTREHMARQMAQCLDAVCVKAEGAA
ncbi:MAG: glycosyltransferase [Gemmataceae bacterium]|nr:glycosyltransferase [Gemmataceae bacterium]MCI0739261.1 glycosyltransferase [Gemmataceae bacterium]